MRVAHQTDHISHAVLGANQAMNFGISDDPAFFQILSQSLYKNPTLAMVRETICNAWDAHIDAGVQDIPLQITLDDNNLIIEDFGPGIPKDLIQPIYGVYGASTKKNDGRQTGGFGLGCKSPFSYNDHFEVTSSHGGVRTIYSMSRSSAKVGGKPSIQPIASFPTDKTGIRVRIPINPAQRNNNSLHKYIKQVVYGGDIKAIYNGEELEVMGLDTSDYGIVLITPNIQLIDQHNRVKVRYGNVLYPVDLNEAYEDELRRVIGVATRHYNSNIIIQAKPDSLSITPSREALTMSDLTINTIKELLVNFLVAFQESHTISDRKDQIIAEGIKGAAKDDAGWFERQIGRSFGAWRVPGYDSGYNFKVLRTAEDFTDMRAHMELEHRQLNGPTWLKSFESYISQIMDDGFINKRLYASWLKVAKKNIKFFRNPDSHISNKQERRVAARWWYEEIGLPMMAKFEEHLPSFDLKKLRYRTGNTGGHWSDGTPSPMRCVSPFYHTSNFAMMSAPIVVISYNADTIDTRMRIYGRSTNVGLTDVQQTNYFHYEVTKRKGHLEEVLEAIGKMDGVYLLDMTPRLPHEQREYEERRDRAAERKLALASGQKPSRRSAKGMVRLDQLVDSNGCYYAPKWNDLHEPEKLTKPEFVVQMSTGANMTYRPNDMDTLSVNDLIMLYGERGGVTSSGSMINRYMDAGAKDPWEFLEGEIVEFLENWPKHKQYYGFSWKKVEDHITNKAGWVRKAQIVSIMKFIRNHPEFNKIIPSGPELTDQERAKLRLWTGVQHHRVISPAMQKLIRFDASIPLDQKYADFITDLCNNPYLEAVDFDHIEKLFKAAKTNPDVKTQTLIDMISAIL